MARASSLRNHHVWFGYTHWPHVAPLAQILNSQISSEFTHWNCLNNVVKSWFYSSVSPSMHPHLRHGTWAAEEWSSLERVHFVSSHARIIELRLSLHTNAANLGSNLLNKMEQVWSSILQLRLRLSTHYPILAVIPITNQKESKMQVRLAFWITNKLS